MLKSFRKRSWLLGLFLVSFLAICLLGVIGQPFFLTVKNFPVVELDLETYDLFDLGVTDINLDGQLDVFTTNHSARQSIALNKGLGTFTEIVSDVGLDQDVQFPGLEDALQKPEFTKPGLYVYRYARALYLHSYQLTEPVSGRLYLDWPIRVDVQTEAEIDVKTTTLTSGGSQSTVDFTIRPEGLLAFIGKEDIVELPHLLSIDPAFPRQQIFVGINRIKPSSSKFELMWRDRHSLAWSDLNQDKKMDVFIARGGIKGQLNKVPELVQDEMMISKSDAYENQILQTGFEKKDCPGRQAAWVDYDGDGQIELYIICGRNNEPTHPNLLYKQQNGIFTDIAPDLGLDFPENGTFQWFDVEQDGDQDLLITKERAVILYLQNQGKFEPINILEEFTGKILNLLIVDFDEDGDLDAYAESKYIDQPNLLLVNDGQTLRPADPKTVALPESGLGASWVDFDNDGLIDFYNVPNGLYRQQPNHQFNATRLIDKHINSRNSLDARSTWADIDNDGDRDLLSAINFTPPIHQRLLNRFLKLDLDRNWQRLWTSELYRNQISQNNWIELELIGSAGNPQAIGTFVTLETPHSKQIQSVGNIDSTYFSQGHYRLYFGVGKDNSANLLTIRWPDGPTQTIKNLEANKIWQIRIGAQPVPL